MKKIWILAVLTAMFCVGTARAEDNKEPKAAKLPNPKEISQEMAVAWCAKMDECAKDKSMGVKECERILVTSFKKGFDQLPKNQPLNLDRDTLDLCKDSIGKGSCESLKGAKSLNGCEFMSRLGQ